MIDYQNPYANMDRDQIPKEVRVNNIISWCKSSRGANSTTDQIAYAIKMAYDNAITDAETVAHIVTEVI